MCKPDTPGPRGLDGESEGQLDLSSYVQVQGDVAATLPPPGELNADDKEEETTDEEEEG